MKITLLLIALVFFSLKGNSQKVMKNSISVPLIRLDANSQTLNGGFNLKFVTGIDYQRNVNKWSFGVKYEHGYNKIVDDCESCYDSFHGFGNMRENNIYLTSDYSVFKLMKSRLTFNTGLSIYYSILNYKGDFDGGISGKGLRENSTYNTIGFAPNVSINYYPTDRLFISVNSTFRYGWSKMFNDQNTQTIQTNEYVLTVPELKVGVRF